MSSKMGAYNTSTDIKWDDPRAQQQAQAMGAILKSDGKLYDAQTGKNISQKDADARAIEAGVAIDSNRPRAGYLNQVYDRNKAYIDPAATILAGVIGGPAGAALMSGGLKYSNTHDIGKSALAAGTSYGASKLLSKIPGVERATNAIKGSSVGQAVSNVGDRIGGSRAGASWDRYIADPLQRGVASLQKNNAAPVGSSGGMGGLTWADILKTGGAVANGIADYSQGESVRKQNAQQFDRMQGTRDNEQLMAIQGGINRLPMADKGQYLMMNQAAPTAFQPRDYTQTGMIDPNAKATGGPADQLAANAKAASNYTPGAGGVDGKTLEYLKQKMMLKSRNG